MRLLLAALLFCSCLDAPAHAALIRSYPMNEWAQMSDDVVYCEEESVEFKEIFHKVEEGNSMDWKETRTIATCRVLESFKGKLVPGQQIVLDYDGIFMRQPWMESFTNPSQIKFGRFIRSVADFLPLLTLLVMARIGYSAILARKQKNSSELWMALKRLLRWSITGWLLYVGINLVLPPIRTPGRCLVFLRNDRPSRPHDIQTAKLVINNFVYEYFQIMNPGPLNLRLQSPENLTLGTLQHYGETELLLDLKLALKKPVTPRGY